MTDSPSDGWDQRYPEHSKIDALGSAYKDVLAFVEWCAEKGYHFEGAYGNDGFSPAQMAARYFGIDLTTIEAERRKMLWEAKTWNE